MKNQTETERGAHISACGKYRYALWRIWEPARRPMVFVMLNPSTADPETDDPTIRRCIGFARAQTCGSLLVVNLGAGRATSPRDWMAMDDPFGPDNGLSINKALNFATERNGIVVAAWGAHGALGNASARFSGAAKHYRDDIYCLGLTKSGQPRHPLYVSAVTPLSVFRP